MNDTTNEVLSQTIASSVVWTSLGLATIVLFVALSAVIVSSILAVNRFKPTYATLTYVASERTDAGNAEDWPSITFNHGDPPASLNSMPFFTTAASPISARGIKTISCQENNGGGGPLGLAFEIETTGQYILMITAAYSVANGNDNTRFNNGIAVRDFTTGPFPGTTLIASCSTTKNDGNEQIEKGETQSCKGVVSLTAGDKLEMVVVAYSLRGGNNSFTFNVVSATFSLAQIQ